MYWLQTLNPVTPFTTYLYAMDIVVRHEVSIFDSSCDPALIDDFSRSPAVSQILRPIASEKPLTSVSHD